MLLTLAATSYEFAELMRKIFPRFVIQPVQQLDTGFVRPRAYLTLNLAALMGSTADDQRRPPAEEIVLDLFEPPVHIMHLESVVALQHAKKKRGEKASLTVLANELKIGRMTVKRALKYKRLIDVEGLTEPYRILREPPATASRWKPRRRPNDQDLPSRGKAA